MCSGRVEPAFILRAFLNGIDGVLVTGCHIGDCHYIKGNEYTLNRMEHIKKLLKKIGIEEERFRLHWISASEGKQFADLIKDFTDVVKKLGESKIPKKIGVIEIQSY